MEKKYTQFVENISKLILFILVLALVTPILLQSKIDDEFVNYNRSNFLSMSEIINKTKFKSHSFNAKTHIINNKVSVNNKHAYMLTPLKLESVNETFKDKSRGAEMDDEEIFENNSELNEENYTIGYKGEFRYFTDLRDGQEYKIIKIGKNYWFAENLRFKPDSGEYWSYNDNDSLVAKYGLLYEWKSANYVCPDGWYLPSDDDWKNLEHYCGGPTDAGVSLKSKLGWCSYSREVQNNLGFSAIAAGLKNDNGKFQNFKQIAAWWTSNEINENNAIYRNMSFENNSVYRFYLNKKTGLSVRCVK